MNFVFLDIIDLRRFLSLNCRSLWRSSSFQLQNLFSKPEMQMVIKHCKSFYSTKIELVVVTF